MSLCDLISESKPKTCHPEKEEAEDKDWSKLGALLLQVEISNYVSPKLQSDVSMGPAFAVPILHNKGAPTQEVTSSNAEK